MSEILLERFERVRTFQISKWRYYDSQLLNPYRLASIGYSCVGINTV